MKAIVSMRELCWRIGIPRERLLAIAVDRGNHYHVWTEYDGRKDKTREYQAPGDELKEIQRRIVARILSEYDLSPAAHGAVKERSPTSNAIEHLGAATVVNVDVVNFFPEVGHRRIFDMFRRDFGFGRDVADVLTQLTTLRGRLPTGAPTSPAIANALLARSVDRPLVKLTKELGISYTRYVDDFTFSGTRARQMINEAAVRLSRLGLKISHKKKKLKISPNSSRQTVTGLVVNSKHGASAGRERIRNVRAAIHELPSLALEERSRALRSIAGRINYVRQFNKGAAKRLMRQLEKAQGVLGE
jgi:RNA-directed DNA polymerase